MSKSKISVIGLAVMLAAGGLTAFGQTAGTAGGQGRRFAAGQRPAAQRARMMQRMRAGGPARLAKALDLTEEQKTQAKAIFKSAKETAKPIRQQMQPLRQQLQQAVKDNNQAQIQAAAAAIAQTHAQLTVIHANAMAKFYQLLTPDQKAKAEQIRQRVKGVMMRRHAGANAQNPV